MAGEDHFLGTEIGKAVVWVAAAVVITLLALLLIMYARWFVSTAIIGGSIIGLLGYVIHRGIKEQW